MPIPTDKFPSVPSLKYEQIKDLIHSGDIILCSGKSLFSKLIKRFTDSIWSHVGFLLRVDQIGRVVVMESVESKGVQVVPLSHYVSNYEGGGKPYQGDVLIARHSHFDESSINHLSRHAVDLLGHRYDNSEILRISARIALSSFLNKRKHDPLQRDNEYICSEYVYECYKSVGITIQHNKGGFISPADFAMDENINPLCFIDKK